MGMFSANGFYVEGASFNDEDIIAQECFEDNMHVAALRVVAESENNWNQIMQAIAVTELASYEETGDADYYITESGSGFLASVKEFFKKLLEKIKGIFQKFIATIDSWSKDDKAFISKYKDKILKANTSDFEFEGYTFTYKKDISFDRAGVKSQNLNNLITGSPTAKTKDEWETITKEFRGDKLEDLCDEYRAAVIDTIATYKPDKCDSSDFSSDMFEALRNGESSKSTIDKVSPIDFITTIQDTGDIKKRTKKAYDALQRGINDAIKDVETAEKNVRKDLPNTTDKEKKAGYVSFCGAFTGFLRMKESINTQAYGAWLQAVKDENRQAKAVCVKLMSYKPKNESTSYYEEGGSLLRNVRFV